MLPGLLLLLFVLVPFLELYLLLQLGARIGTLPTLGMIVVTGLVGAALARTQGFAALQRIQRELAAGQMPAGALLEGVLILLAGVLLIAPGVLTDVVGVLLLVPPTRALVARGLTRWARGRIQVVHGVSGAPPGGAPWGAAPWPPSTAGRRRGDVIDVEAVVREPSKGDDPSPPALESD